MAIDVATIRQILHKIGLESLPQDEDGLLDAYGFDSLLLALFVLEAEKVFKVKLPVELIRPTHFSSIAIIAKTIARVRGDA